MSSPRYPSLYQINTRVWLTHLSRPLGRPATLDDIPGSGFAITGYTVHEHLGGDAALARLRDRMRTRGLRLMLDFVPNHMAPDHPWALTHPEYFVSGNEADLVREPQNYMRVQRP